MKPIALLFAATLAALSVSAQTAPAVTTPASLNFCGIEVSFTPAMRLRMETYVNELLKYPTYFNKTVERCDTYMPFVEEALANVNAPTDLKYLAIQESNLKATAVSKSNAVGFWQFKLDAAQQYGLRVSAQVDERMHIYRASEAAGLYFVNANRDFNNWIYAVIAYYEGLTGAVKYTDPRYYGAKSMTVDTTLHFYIMRAMCHKIAYGPSLDYKRPPKVWLEPVSTLGFTQVADLYKNPGIDPVLFFEYNAWILDQTQLPANQTFTYYLPRTGAYPGHKPDPNKVPGGGIPVYVSPTAQPAVPATPTQPTTPEPAPAITVAPPASAPSQMAQTAYVEFRLQSDLHYGTEFAYYTGDMLMAEIATKYGVSLENLASWNNLVPGTEPNTGTILYLKQPKDRLFYIVRNNESLTGIAIMNNMRTRKLQKLNNMPKSDMNIYLGQKLYLKERKPHNEKVIILVEKFGEQPVAQAAAPKTDTKPSALESSLQQLPPKPAQPTTTTPATQPAANPAATTQPATPAAQPAATPQSRWITHTVAPGETLWQIAQKYGTKVEIIKVSNKLTTDSLATGQQLQIFAKEDKIPAGTPTSQAPK